VTSVDLEALRRSEPAPARGGLSLRHVAWTVVLVAAGAGVVLVALPWLRPHRRVATAAVRIETGAAARAASVAEATGWIEPSPFPTIVKPLVDGIVESIEVLEGQEVGAGRTVARLRNFEKEVSLERARAAVALAQANVLEAQADLDEARALLEQKLDLRSEVARLEGEAAVAERESAAARAEADAAEGRLRAARAELAAQEGLDRQGTGTPLLLEKARGDAAAAAGEVAAREAAALRADAAKASASTLAALAREGLENPKALEWGVKRHAAHLEAVKAEEAAERKDLEIAEREVALLTVVAPVAGVVLRREAAPGSVVGPAVMPALGVGGEMDADSGVGGVVSLYDPMRLQARVLVPLEAASAASVGRRVEVSADTVPGRVFSGEVTRIESEVDVRLPRVEVKVSIDDPDPLLKPGVFVRARFLAPSRAEGGEAPAPRVLVPRAAVRGDAVFVVDPRGGGRARRVPVVKVSEDGDWVEVRGDVGATNRVILEEVHDGDRVAAGDPS
jgi:multidrug efflux pump subunit AcrA (membrane-fusion protein)